MPDYIQDPNNSKKTVPGLKPDQYFDRTQLPNTASFTKQPHYILIGGTLTGDVNFFFGSSASFSENSTQEIAGITPTLTSSGFYVGFGQPSAGTKLDINPCAWSGSGGDVNKVIFVYKGGLDGQGRP